MLDHIHHELRPPYYVVLFTSKLREGDRESYFDMAEAMFQRVQEREGYLGFESARREDGYGITASYWRSPEDIRRWREDLAHQRAQQLGKQRWYSDYRLRVCLVESEYSLEDRLDGGSSHEAQPAVDSRTDPSGEDR